jgi:hypothetical protein
MAILAMLATFKCQLPRLTDRGAFVLIPKKHRGVEQKEVSKFVPRQKTNGTVQNGTVRSQLARRQSAYRIDYMTQACRVFQKFIGLNPA